MTVSFSFGSLLSLAAPLAITLMLIVLALLSKRLGEVTRHPPTYRWFFVSAAIIIMAMCLRIGMAVGDAVSEEQIALLYNLSLVAGLTVAAMTTWQYWGWLLGDRGVERERSRINSTYVPPER